MIGGKIDCNEYKYFPLGERNVKSYTSAASFISLLSIDKGNFSTHHIRRQTLADSDIGIGNSAPLVD